MTSELYLLIFELYLLTYDLYLFLCFNQLLESIRIALDKHFLTVLLSIPFNYLHCYSRSQQWMEQQIGSPASASASTNHNGLYVESFSSSTDPSFYRASTSHEDTNLDDDDWLVRIFTPDFFLKPKGIQCLFHIVWIFGLNYNDHSKLLKWFKKVMRS